MPICWLSTFWRWGQSVPNYKLAFIQSISGSKLEVSKVKCSTYTNFQTLLSVLFNPGSAFYTYVWCVSLCLHTCVPLIERVKQRRNSVPQFEQIWAQMELPRLFQGLFEYFQDWVISSKLYQHWGIHVVKSLTRASVYKHHRGTTSTYLLPCSNITLQRWRKRNC